MLLPIRSKNPPESFPVGTVLLIIANVVVYAFTSDMFLSIKDPIVENYGLSYNNMSPLTFFSSTFLHADLFHLLGNMWFLYLFGFAVEGRFRTPKFLAVYFLAGLAGDALHLALMGAREPDLPSIGASGAIMGVMGAAIYMFPHAKVMMLYFFGIWWYGITDWAMWVVGLIYVGLDVLGALVSATGGGVAHLAHLGGVGGGFLICMLLRTHRDDAYTSEAKASLDETKDLSLLSASELQALYEINPKDHKIITHWMLSIIRGRSYSTLPAGTGYSSHYNPQKIDPMAMQAGMGFMSGPPKPTVLGQGGSSPDTCIRAFLGALPQLVKEMPAATMSSILLQFPADPGSIPSYAFFEVGTKLEREGQGIQALQMYDHVLKHPQPSQSDLEAAMFRSGVLCEGQIANFERSAHCYREIIRVFPMSTFADNARSRLANLQKSGRIK
ncbi:MAG: rhomboid family intramembrane serine protease [Fimbriimonadaceae bacterium]|nr:rhomboid family intramembrane serine protease [Fimbriimonadaceae bacterium]